MRLPRWGWAALAAGLVVLVVVVLAAGGSSGGGEPQTFGPSAADPVPYDGRSPAEPPQRRERVLVELPRPALGALRDLATLDAARRRSYVASLKDEATALLSALDARGVKTSDVVTYERTWHGFAATVDAADLPGLESLGVRLRPDRRLYPALSQPVPLGTGGPTGPTGAAGGPTGPVVALLGGGVAGKNGGYDAIDHDGDPAPSSDPRDARRAEAGGAPVAALLGRLGVTARVIRVSALRTGAGLAGAGEFGRTDELLDGLEHAVDPDSDGDPADHLPVALVAVNAPYAGFADAPEAEAARGAARLGTLVVAPAGHEGPATGAYGTIGSPGAAASAVAVAPLSDARAVARTTLRVGNVTVRGAAVLAGAPPRGTLRTSRPVSADTATSLLHAGLAGRVAVVDAGANPGAQVAAAAGAGAAAVIVAEDRLGHRLSTIPAGRVGVPVLGVTQAAAAAILTRPAGSPVTASAATGPRSSGPIGATLSPFASRGPAFDGADKPELARAGSVVVGGALVSGAAIAAAQVAADAARLHASDARAARRALLAATDAVRKAGRGHRTRPPAPEDVPVGALTVRREGGHVGVDFTVGTFDRGDPDGGRGARIVPAAFLELALRRAKGGVVRRLTPPGGAVGLLPGEYAFTLPPGVLKGLTAGRYAFAVRARAPRQRRATVATSEPFRVP